MNESQVKELIERKDIDGLIAALSSNNMDVRTAAANGLGKIGDERAINSLIEALNDTTDYPVFKEPLQVPCTPIDARGEAAIALGKIGGEAAIVALKAVVDTSPEKGVYRGLSVGEAVKKALVELGAVDRGEKQILEESNGSEQKAEIGSRRSFLTRWLRGPEKSSEEMVKISDELRIQGKLRKALRWAKRATNKDPSNGYAWMERGLVEVDRRHVVSATRAFVMAVSVTPKLKGSEPGARLAVVYDSLGMREERDDMLVSLYNSGLGLHPNAEREWEQLVTGVNPRKLRAAIAPV